MPAPAPFFLTYAELRSTLRLTDIPDGKDAELQLQAAVREGRTTLWRALTAARIVQLQAMTAAEPPTTDDHHLRHLAIATEINVVRLHLFEYFSAAFNESRSPTQEWNVEGLARNVSQYNIVAQKSAIRAQIEEAFGLLRGQESAGNETSVSVGVPESDDFETNGPLALGSSILGAGGIFTGRVGGSPTGGD